MNRLSVSCVLLLLLLSLLLILVVSSTTPIQKRIALLPHGMTVSWSTTSALQVAPSVLYSVDPSWLNMNASGFSSHYASSTTWFHHVELNNLLPSMTYYWIVDGEAQTEVHSFTTAPDLSKGQPGTFSVSIYGDLGIDNSVDTLNLLRKIASGKTVDLFWHIGDLSYADDHSDTPFTYEQIYEGWMNNMTEIWDETPYMFCPGNHENSGGANSSVSQGNFTAYRERFHMPYQYSSGPNNMFYSFDYGLVHFINIDTEVSFPGAPEGKYSGPFGDQEKWLRADLDRATANRAKVPWILIGGHRPFYATDGYLQPQMDFFQPIFADYDIDIVFVGHIHYYERMYSINSNGTVCSKSYDDTTCPIYIISGAAGNIEGLTHVHNRTEPYTAMIYENFGVGILNIASETQLTWNFLRSSDGAIVDTVTINKKHGEQREMIHDVKKATE